jgi:deazaflavin-dependent oxidoreductase (nitroreductase family)
MDRTDKVPFYTNLMNPIVKSMVRLGVPIGAPVILLTVHGRRTGRPHTTPVGLFERDGHRFLFATFGEVDWVRNLRATGEAIITRGRHREAVVAVELTPEEAAPIMKDVFASYLASSIRSSALRMGYDLKEGATMDDYLKEAKRHPGFELHSKSTD